MNSKSGIGYPRDDNGTSLPNKTKRERVRSVAAAPQEHAAAHYQQAEAGGFRNGLNPEKAGEGGSIASGQRERVFDANSAQGARWPGNRWAGQAGTGRIRPAATRKGHGDGF